MTSAKELFSRPLTDAEVSAIRALVAFGVYTSFLLPYIGVSLPVTTIGAALIIWDMLRARFRIEDLDATLEKAAEVELAKIFFYLLCGLAYLICLAIRALA